ncbi:MAG: hypothetical protein Q7T82_04920 [Armatimonadota bacterium]|nr:hypothetical protein [Armatimonadota bacterium]
MSMDKLSKLVEDIEKTPGYQLESAIVDVTEDICEIMEAKGLSRADLARELGKSRAWATKVLRGDHNMTLKTVVEVFWSLGYRLKMQPELTGSNAAWTQTARAYASESVVTVHYPRTPAEEASRYEEELVEQTLEAVDVSSVAA